MDVMKLLHEYKTRLVGSTALFDEGDDIDIVVCIPDSVFPDSPWRIMNAIIAKGGQAEVHANYEIPFSWGGKTFWRIWAQDGDIRYDIFGVNPATYHAICEVQSRMNSLVHLEGWEKILKNKAFRVGLFQMLGGLYIDTGET